MVIALIYKRQLSLKDTLILKRPLISNMHDAEAASRTTSVEMPFGNEGKGQKSPRKRTNNWPDFRGLDLSNNNDLCSAHALLVAFGKARDDYEGLRQVVLAGVIARRLARRHPLGYFVAVLREGMGCRVRLPRRSHRRQTPRGCLMPITSRRAHRKVAAVLPQPVADKPVVETLPPQTAKGPAILPDLNADQQTRVKAIEALQSAAFDIQAATNPAELLAAIEHGAMSLWGFAADMRLRSGDALSTNNKANG